MTLSNNSAEYNLLDMVKNKDNKHAYVTTKLNELSRILNKIKVIDDVSIVKYLMLLTVEEFSKNTGFSELNFTERTHLVNALKTRGAKCINLLECNV